MFGRRIANRILLGYVIPLAILVVMGVIVPAALSYVLTRITAQDERNSRLVETVLALDGTAKDSETHLRGYLLSGRRDPDFRDRFEASQFAYGVQYRQAQRFAEGSRRQRELLADADAAYRRWRDGFALPRLRGAVPLGDAGTGIAEFQPVREAMARASQYSRILRDRQSRRAQAAENMRRLMTLVGPVVAVVLALLIGRSLALGVTRPLEALTAATEALEQGQNALLLDLDESEPADDEIGDLRRSFARMARTTGQREAVLRAQNEALGALNRRVEAVLNATNDGIVLLDRAGGFAVINRRCAELFAIDADVLQDQSLETAGPVLIAQFRDGDAVRASIGDLLDDPDAIADDTFETVRRTMLRVYSAPVRGGSGDLIGRIFVFRDVTRETVVDRMKTEFISVVSHELRTPLTAIKGYVDVVLAEQAGPITDVQREFLGIVQSSTMRLTALINDMLDISRIESGRVELRHEKTDYAALVRDAVATLAHEAEARNLALAMEIPPDLPPVAGDAGRIMQVLTNLLSNAIKYTPSGGRVTIQAELDAGGSFVQTAVIDTGIGIAPEDQAKLFQKFFRADNSTTREAGGTGLGLAITKAIVERLNGGIWFESEFGRGSRFCFTLPVNAVATGNAAAHSETSVTS